MAHGAVILAPLESRVNKKAKLKGDAMLRRQAWKCQPSVRLRLSGAFTKFQTAPLHRNISAVRLRRYQPEIGEMEKIVRIVLRGLRVQTQELAHSGTIPKLL